MKEIFFIDQIRPIYESKFNWKEFRFNPTFIYKVSIAKILAPGWVKRPKDVKIFMWSLTITFAPMIVFLALGKFKIVYHKMMSNEQLENYRIGQIITPIIKDKKVSGFV